MKDGVFYVGAFSGKAKKDGRPFGKVDFVSIENGRGQVQTAFCDADVAERAMHNLRIMEPVRPHFETTLTGRGPTARLVEVEPLAAKANG